MEKTINEYTNIEEPIIVKRKNNNDLVILSMEEYKKKLFFNELDRKIQEGEEDIKKVNKKWFSTSYYSLTLYSPGLKLIHIDIKLKKCYTLENSNCYM